MRPLSTEADADGEHDGAVPVTGITRTLEPGMYGPTHAQHMKTSGRFQSVGVAMVLSNVLNTEGKTSFLPPVAKTHEKPDYYE